jgi:hypothetical protein
MERVLDVARQGHDPARPGGVDGRPRRLQGGGPAGVDDEVPAVGGEALGERSAEPPAGSSDECSSAHAWHGKEPTGRLHRPEERFCLGRGT